MIESHWLLVVEDSVSPQRYGPFDSMAEVEAELIRLIRRKKLRLPDDDVFHCHVMNGTPYFYSFSAGYMDNVEEYAKYKSTKACDPAFPLHTVAIVCVKK